MSDNEVVTGKYHDHLNIMRWQWVLTRITPELHGADLYDEYNECHNCIPVARLLDVFVVETYY